MKEMSNRRFFVIAAILLIITVSGSWFIGHAGARGVVQTIDVGEPFDAQAHKNPLPANQRVWINGTYSASKIDNATVEFILEPGTSNLYVKSVLTITPSGGPALTWGGYTTSENRINYSYGPHYVEYQTWDSYFKEWLILTEKPKTIEWQMTFDSRASVEQDADNYYVKFTDKEITPFYITIPKPFVIDKNGINRQLSYSYNPGKNTLTLNLDDSGLTYPLAIDPVYAVDSGGTTGLAPILLINSTGIAQIVYADSTNSMLKLAQNVTGTWTTASLFNIYSTPATGAIIDPVTDLPIIVSSGTDRGLYNFTWNYLNRWRTQYVTGFVHISSVPIGAIPILKSTSGRVLFTTLNGTYGNYNCTRIESISGASVTSYEQVFFVAAINYILQSGKTNTSGTLNLFWRQYNDATLTVNWTTITDSSSPTITTITNLPIYLNSTTTTSGAKLVMDINPTTDFPAVAYVKYIATGSGPDRYGRQINFSYYKDNVWYHEIPYSNVTSMSSIRAVGLRYNSTGIPYIAFAEDTGNTNSRILHLTYRTTPGTWTTPITIDNGVGTRYPISIEFDTNDNIHIAFYDEANGDLMYYFEPLPSAGAGAAPVASFTATPQAGIRNSSRAIVDQSTNTPTSVSLYGSTPHKCIGTNVSFTPGGAVNIFPANASWCSVCLIASNAFGTGTTCTKLYVSQPWTVF